MDPADDIDKRASHWGCELHVHGLHFGDGYGDQIDLRQTPEQGGGFGQILEGIGFDALSLPTSVQYQPPAEFTLSISGGPACVGPKE
jgi:hypothetical protein